MHERAVTLPGRFVTDGATDADALSREFEARLVECSTLAFRVAYGVLRHREDAEDAAQEAFTRAYRSFGQLRDRDRFRAWIVKATWRVAITRYHEKKRRGGRELAVDIDAVSPDSADAVERAGRLWRAIDALPEKLRMTLVLAGIEGHNIREVAALLDVPEGTVKSRLFDARKQLKERLS
jgi:RNA polymerase sigma-70 factor (ECF subfamily)